MLYCFTEVNDKNRAEVNYAMKNQNFVFFDKIRKKFYSDFNQKEEQENLKGETILPRTSSEEETEELIDILLNMGAIPLYWDLVKYKNIMRWPTLRVTDRRIVILTAEEFEEKNPQLEKMIDELSDENKMIFLKIQSGSFAKKVLKSDLLDSKSSIRRTISEYPDEEVMISKPINILEDDLGKVEYSCVVKDGKLESISRFTDTVYHNVEDKILEACKQKVQILSESNQVPRSYVLNVAEYEDEKEELRVDITDIKPIYSAVFWLYNSLLDVTTDREEKIDNIYQIDPLKKEQFMEEGISPRSFATEEDVKDKDVVPDEFTKTFESHEKQKQQVEKKQQSKPWSLSNWFKEKE